MGTILIVEDEVIIRQSLCRLLARHGHTVSVAESAEEAMARFTLTDFDLILTDLRLPGESGTALIALAAPKPVLVMTSYASLKSAIEAMKMGAANYIAKPFDHDEMVKLVRELITPPPPSKKTTQQKQPYLSIVFSDNEPMRSLLKTLEHVAPTPVPLVFTGETGTGKTVLAHHAHALSGRTGPLISLDCASFSATITHQTAPTPHTGSALSPSSFLKAAHEGTLLIRNITELTLTAQSVLLPWLDASINRSHSTHVHDTPARPSNTSCNAPNNAPHNTAETVNVRVMVTSQHSLNQLRSKGQLREDLYHRLMGISLTLPPLHERTGDALTLMNHFVSYFSQQYNKPKLHLCHESQLLIEQYHWPGNVRELRNAIERGTALTTNDTITPDMLFNQEDPINHLDNRPTEARTETRGTPFMLTDDDMSLDEYFQHFVLENQNQMTETELAQKLGISRKTLWERRQKMGIPRKRSVATLSSITNDDLPMYE